MSDLHVYVAYLALQVLSVLLDVFPAHVAHV